MIEKYIKSLKELSPKTLFYLQQAKLLKEGEGFVFSLWGIHFWITKSKTNWNAYVFDINEYTELLELEKEEHINKKAYYGFVTHFPVLDNFDLSTIEQLFKLFYYVVINKEALIESIKERYNLVKKEEKLNDNMFFLIEPYHFSYVDKVWKCRDLYYDHTYYGDQVTELLNSNSDLKKEFIRKVTAYEYAN